MTRPEGTTPRGPRLARLGLLPLAYALLLSTIMGVQLRGQAPPTGEPPAASAARATADTLSPAKEPKLLELVRRARREEAAQERVVGIGLPAVPSLLTVLREPNSELRIQTLASLLGRITRQEEARASVWQGIRQLIGDRLFVSRRALVRGLFAGLDLEHRKSSPDVQIFAPLSRVVAGRHFNAKHFPPVEFTALIAAGVPEDGGSWPPYVYEFFNHRWPWEAGVPAQTQEAAALEGLMLQVLAMGDEAVQVHALLSWYGHPRSQEVFTGLLDLPRAEHDLPLWAAYCLLDSGSLTLPLAERWAPEAARKMRELILPHQLQLSNRPQIQPGSAASLRERLDALTRSNARVWYGTEAVAAIIADAELFLRCLEPFTDTQVGDLNLIFLMRSQHQFLKRARSEGAWPQGTAASTGMLSWTAQDSLRLAQIASSQMKALQSAGRQYHPTAKAWSLYREFAADWLLHAIESEREVRRTPGRSGPRRISQGTSRTQDLTARLQPTMPSYRPEAVTKLLIEKALQGELDVFGNARDTWLSVFREAELPLEQVLLLLQARQSWARDIAHARLAALPPAEGLPSSIPQELLDDARWQAARDLRPFEGWRSRLAKTRLAIARWPAAVADAALRSLYEHDLEVLQTDAGTASSPLRMQGIATAWSPSSVAPWELMRALPDGQERIRSLVRALTRAALTPSGELSPQGAMLVKSALRPLFARRGQTPLPIAESLALLDVVPPSLQAEVWSLGYSTPEGKRGPLKSLEWLLRAPPVARQLLGLHRPFIGTYLEPDQLLEATRFLLSQAGFPEEVVIETLAFAEATRLVEAFPEVRALASGPPSEVRTKAFDTLKALVELRTVQKAAAATELRDEVFEKAQRLAKSEDPARRRAAAGLFARMGDDRSLLELALLSDDEDPAVRWAVAIALSPGTEKR